MRRLLTVAAVVLAVGGAAVALAARGERDVPGIGVPERIREDASRVRNVLSPRSLPAPACPASAPDCVRVTGRVIYVERVDPDGDGDMHVVVAGGSVTLPGISTIKVGQSLRPQRAPRLGDRAAAAGTVIEGARGEDELRALVFRVRHA